MADTVTPSDSALDRARAFEIALSEDRRQRPKALLAYFGLIPGLQFGPCEMCRRIGFLEKSGLSGFTCAECEFAHDEAFNTEVSNA